MDADKSQAVKAYLEHQRQSEKRLEGIVREAVSAKEKELNQARMEIDTLQRENLDLKNRVNGLDAGRRKSYGRLEESPDQPSNAGAKTEAVSRQVPEKKYTADQQLFMGFMESTSQWHALQKKTWR